MVQFLYIYKLNLNLIYFVIMGCIFHWLLIIHYDFIYYYFFFKRIIIFPIEKVGIIRNCIFINYWNYNIFMKRIL